MPPVVKRLLPALLLIAAGVGALWLYGRYEREVGRRDARIAEIEQQADSLRERAARVDTVYRQRVDTLRLVRAHTDSVLVLLPGDTVTRIRVDTVRQLVERERAACDAVILSCEARVAARDSIIAVQVEELRTVRRQSKLFGIPLPSRGAMFGIGVTVGHLLTR